MTSPTVEDILSKHLDELLDSRAYPKTICPSEVVRSLSLSEVQQCNVKDWRDLMPRIRQLAWECRDRGELEVLQKGEVVDSGVALEDIKGPIRLRRRKDGDNTE